MRTITSVHIGKHTALRDLLHDSRFWAVVGIVIFVVGFTTLVIWAAQHGTPYDNGMPYQPYWPYGPYGPVPMR